MFSHATVLHFCFSQLRTTIIFLGLYQLYLSAIISSFVMRTIVVVFFMFQCFSFSVNGFGLSYNFYEKSCPQVEDIVRNGLQPMFLTDPTSAPALLRLMFHDCQVQVGSALMSHSLIFII